MSLQSLPNEIFLLMLSYLPSHYDVAALSLQCHRWHRLCDMSHRRKYCRVKIRGTLDMALAFKMLRSILETPRYGGYVRHVELNRSLSLLRTGFLQTYIPKPPQRSLRPKDQDRLSVAINQAFDCPEEQKKVLNVLLQKPASMDHNDPRAPFLAQALAALLVSVSPLLESLSFCPIAPVNNGTSLRENDYFFKHFLDRASNIPQEALPFLHHLRHVRFLIDSDTRIYLWYNYQPFDLHGSLNLVRRLPAVETIRVDAIMTVVIPNTVPPRRSANYTSITIQDPNIDYCHLVQVIESAKRLKEFTYTAGGRGKRRPIRNLSLDHVFQALLLHAESLMNLNLNVEAETQLAETFNPTASLHQPPHQLDLGLPRSLRGFPNMKKLSLGIHTLYYLSRGIGVDRVDDASFAIVDHLPPNLEGLCIYGYKKGATPQVEDLPDDVFDRQLEKLLAEKDAKLPRLSCIEGIDEFMEHATTVKQPEISDEYLWEKETDDEWTDHEYD